jgi:C-terminal processing protease CtpA/Prc
VLFRSPNGKEWTGGIEPDVKVEPTAQEYFAGRDEVLDKAVDIIKQRLAPKKK